jgi:hypothetical protein
MFNLVQFIGGQTKPTFHPTPQPATRNPKPTTHNTQHATRNPPLQKAYCEINHKQKAFYILISLFLHF